MRKQLAGIALALCLASMSFASDTGIRITMDEPTPNRAIPWPAQAAVVLPDGFAKSIDEFSLVDAMGKPTAAWLLPVSYWRAGGSLKWLHLRFIALPGGEYRLVKSAAQPQEKLPLDVKAGTYTVRTGKLEVVLSKAAFKVGYAGNPMADGLRQRILDGHGQPFAGSVDAIEVERHTPVEVTFLITGKYGLAAIYKQRISIFKDVPVVFFDHAFQYVGDMNKDKFQEISVELGLPRAPEKDVRFLLGAEGEKTFALDPAFKSISMAQELCFHNNDDAPYLKGIKPLSREWADATAKGEKSEFGPDHYGLYGNQEQGEKVLHEGKRCGDGLIYSSGGAPVAAVLADFWQNFPKEWEISPTALKLHLWSKRGGDLDFSQAWGQRWYRAVKMLKTGGGEVRVGDPRTLEKRELFLLAFGDEAIKSGVAGYASKAPEAVVDPAAICAAQPFDLPVVPRGANNADPKLKTIEDSIDALFADMMKAVADTGGYGWQEAGHGPHYQYDWDENANRLMVANYRWYGHFYYMQRNLWMQYLRGGDRKYLDMLYRHYRHFLDIEIAHSDLRNNISAGSWCKDALCYWENWQEGWYFTYQVHARGIMYYYARTGDPRALWQLQQWRAHFLKKTEGKNLAEWADKYRDWGGAEFTPWRVPCTAIGNLVALYEMFGDQRLLDMALALALSFEDTKSPSGTKFIYSANEVEYTMWSGHDEYYRILHFLEICKLTNDPRAIAMTQKLVHYWLRQREDNYGSYDLVALTAWATEKNPVAASMLKTYVEDAPAREGYLAKLRRPFGPGGPQGDCHPSNDEKRVFGMYPYLIAAYPEIIKAGGEPTALRRFKTPGDSSTWVGRKAAGKPFVMSVFCPGRDRNLKFADQSGAEIPAQFVTRDDFVQKTGWMHVLFTLRLPAAFPAGQIWSSGDPGHVKSGSEDTYLFYPGATLYMIPDSSTVRYFKFGGNRIATGGDAKFSFLDSAGNELAPKDKDASGSLLFDPPGGILGIEAQVHPTHGAFVNLAKVPPEKRFGFIGDPKGFFEVAPAVLQRISEARSVAAIPPLDQPFADGVSGQAFLVTEERGLALNAPLNASTGCIEFWIKPLWDTEHEGGRMLMNSNVVNLSAPNVSLFRATAGGEGSAQGSFDIARPEGDCAPLQKGKWYHVAMTWRVLAKKEGRIAQGSGLVYMTINGEFQRVSTPHPINARIKPDQLLTFSAAKGVVYLVDEIRVSKSPRYLVQHVPGFTWHEFGGFDLATVRKPVADADTLCLYHLDGNLKGEGTLGAARALEIRGVEKKP